MKLAIIGSREFNDYDLLCEVLNPHKEKISLIISGGAKGADSLAERWAKENNIQTKVFIPEWDKYGKSAGFKRNILIIDECDSCIAFWDGSSKGTKSSIDLCIKNNKKHSIILYEKANRRSQVQ